MVKVEILVGENDKEYRILIGENAKENTELIKQSEPNDLWFHFEKLSSPFLILETKGETLHKKYLNETASKLFKYKNVKDNVIYTEVKNVKLTKTPGLVEPRNLNVIKFK